MNRFLILLIVALLPIGGISSAEQSPARLEILPGYRSGDGAHIAGLRISLLPGWKTYWRAPGMTGYPPQFGIKGSDNVDRLEVVWPRPSLLESYGDIIIGYDDEVTLPLRLTLSRQGVPAHLILQIDMGVCKDVCLPLQAQIAIDLPARTGPRDLRIIDALAARPVLAQGSAKCELLPGGRGISITMNAPVGELQDPYAVVEYPGLAMRQNELQKGGARLTARAQSYGNAAIARDDLRLTLIGRAGRAVEYRGCE